MLNYHYMLQRLKRKLKNYVSEEDQFIHRFDAQQRARSFSQKQEVSKHARIFRLRDNVMSKPKTQQPTIWKDF